MAKIQYVAAASLFFAAAACSPKVDTRGYASQEMIKEQVTVGSTTKEEVLSRLGSPSSQSTFGDETWYYISERKEGVAFMKPEVVNQQVVGLHFDQAGVVQKVDNYSEKDGKEVAIVNRTTPTEGHTLGFFEQVLGNIGRFNSGDPGSSAAPGRKPGHGTFP